MSAEQLPLLISQAPAVSPDDVAEMKAKLRGRGWVLARDLGGANESEKRRLREIARASGGHIISGQKGYRLTLEASHEEYWHARDWLNHQANEMKARVAEIDRVWHARPERAAEGEMEGAA